MVIYIHSGLMKVPQILGTVSMPEDKSTDEVQVSEDRVKSSQDFTIGSSSTTASHAVAHKRIYSDRTSLILRVISCVMITMGLMISVAITSAGLLMPDRGAPTAMQRGGEFSTWGLRFFVGGLTVSFIAATALLFAPPLTPIIGHSTEAHRRRFARHMIGIGAVMVMGGVVNATAFAGYAFSGLTNSRWQDADAAVALLCSTVGLTLLGALFYIASRVWIKMQSTEEPFNKGVFWGGLWFRLGEALVFMAVFFWLITVYASEEDNLMVAMPLLGLLVGMFLKAGEKLITGLASRVFASVEALIPPRDERSRENVAGLAYLLEPRRDTSDPLVQKLIDRLEGLNGVVDVQYEENPAFDNSALSELRVLCDRQYVSVHQIESVIRHHGFAAKRRSALDEEAD